VFLQHLKSCEDTRFFSAQTAGLSSVVQLMNTPFPVLTVTAGMGSAGSLGMFISPTQL